MKTILILENDPSVMRFLRHALKQYHLIEATTAEEALHLFAERGRHVDLLLADVTLPTSSGLRVAFFLRSEIRTLPVILTSGCPVSNWNDQDTADLLRLGSGHLKVIQKPFHSHKIAELVSKLLGTESSGTALALGENP